MGVLLVLDQDLIAEPSIKKERAVTTTLIQHPNSYFCCEGEGESKVAAFFSNYWDRRSRTCLIESMTLGTDGQVVGFYLSLRTEP